MGVKSREIAIGKPDHIGHFKFFLKPWALTPIRSSCRVLSRRVT